MSAAYARADDMHPRAAPVWKSLLAQSREEIRMTLGHGERLLVTFAIPIAALLLFAQVPILSTGTSSRIDFYTPSVLCLAIVSTAMVNLSIATGFERSWSVLKRLRSSPLSGSVLVGAKIISVVVVEVVQTGVLVAIAFALGWHPHGNPGLVLGAEVAGTAAFAGLGLALAGTMRAEIVLALANGLYLLLIAISGIMFPLTELGSFARFARLLPSSALANVLRAGLVGTGDIPMQAWIVLAAWAIGGPVVAAATFRFE